MSPNDVFIDEISSKLNIMRANSHFETIRIAPVFSERKEKSYDECWLISRHFAKIQEISLQVMAYIIGDNA